jgi:hypothetical protein
MVELCLHSPICLQGIVRNLLGTGTTLRQHTFTFIVSTEITSTFERNRGPDYPRQLNNKFNTSLLRNHRHL